MKIFEPQPTDNNDEWVTLVNEADHEVFQLLDEQPVAATWRPLPATLVRNDTSRKKRLRAADLPWFLNHVLVLRDDANERVAPLLLPFGELLPLDCDSARLSVFHATNLLDVLDEEWSEIVRFDSGRIMSIEKYAFKERRIRPPQVFAIPQYLSGAIYLTEDVVQSIEKLGLTGTAFRYLADAEVSP